MKIIEIVKDEPQKPRIVPAKITIELTSDELMYLQALVYGKEHRDASKFAEWVSPGGMPVRADRPYDNLLDALVEASKKAGLPVKGL